MAGFEKGRPRGDENSRGPKEHLPDKRIRLISGSRRGHPIVVIGVGGPFVVFVSNYPQHVGFMLLILPSALDRLEGVLECHSD